MRFLLLLGYLSGYLSLAQPTAPPGQPNQAVPQWEHMQQPGTQQVQNLGGQQLIQPNAQSLAQPNTGLATEETADAFDAGRKDPFKLPTHIIDMLKIKGASVQSTAAQETHIEANPLKRWPLEEYSLVGVVWNVSSPKAMITDKEGKMHVIRIKDRLGVLQAIVIRIEEGRVIFNEKGNLKTLHLRK